MAGNFDSIALFYDSIAQLVFGKTLRLAQTHLLHTISPGSRILIAGGGTGWILEELTIVHSAGLHITYIDNSAQMIALARKKNAADNQVEFVTESIKTVHLTGTYNVIITNFFFDVFTPADALQVFEKLDRHVNGDTLWLYCDFYSRQGTRFAQKALLKIMYTFFRLVCGIEAKKLPDMDLFFTQAGYRIILEKKFLGHFIVSRMYQPPLPE